MPVKPFLSTDDLLSALASDDGALGIDGIPAEAVDPLAHHLQCAHRLSLVAPGDLELQVAGLVHDVGHILDPGDVSGHGRTGAEAVRSLLGERVARLVELHVPAKRYLATVEATYRARLSPASTASLVAQGGPMDAIEAGVFAADPDLDAALVLRSADEAAKFPGLSMPDLEHWRPVVETVAAGGQAPPKDVG
ncbi:MAG: HD domain-containing protein [Actinomycetota bacterium]|jgi:predicted HD phosphohydrolase|nr:HD domain-containing protein [Actinomycetota bacterium]